MLNHTGYMPLYRFVWGNAVLHKTYNGQATKTTAYSPGQAFDPGTQWAPSWYNTNTTPKTANPEKVYHVDVAGWRDKYIKMPEGAQNDVYKIGRAHV